jgi:hypothetical protein
MIDVEFIDKTSALIKHINNYDIHLLNGELLIAKQPPVTETKGGLIIAESAARRDSYFHGFGRVLKTPSSTFKVTGGELPEEPLIKQGDYILFNHTGRYKPYPALINFLLDTDVEDKSVKDQYEGEYSDVGMLFIVPQQEVKIVRDGHSVYRQVANV